MTQNVDLISIFLSIRGHFLKLNSGSSGIQRLNCVDYVKAGRTCWMAGLEKSSIEMGQGQEGKESS
jgi:hypothetical protein